METYGPGQVGHVLVAAFGGRGQPLHASAQFRGGDLADRLAVPDPSLQDAGNGRSELLDPEERPEQPHRGCLEFWRALKTVHTRSEERRVGKEGRSRWSPY